MKRPVKALTLGIPFRMVWSHSALLDAIDGAEFFDDLTFKVSALVTVDPLWYTIRTNHLAPVFLPLSLLAGLWWGLLV